MTLVRRLQIACILLTGTSLALAFVVYGRGRWSWAFVVISLLWWYGERRAWAGVGFVGMTAFVLVAVVGILSGISPLWMVATSVVVLAAWDLEGLERRLGHRKQDTLLQGILNRHLRKLVVVIVVGILAAGFAMVLQARFSFWVVVGLSLLLAFSLSRALALLQ